MDLSSNQYAEINSIIFLYVFFSQIIPSEIGVATPARDRKTGTGKKAQRCIKKRAHGARRIASAEHDLQGQTIVPGSDEQGAGKTAAESRKRIERCATRLGTNKKTKFEARRGLSRKRQDRQQSANESRRSRARIEGQGRTHKQT